MARAKKSMDGNTAAAHVSYAFTEVASIYPISLLCGCPGNQPAFLLYKKKRQEG